MNKIVEVAKSYVGQEEISGNMGFKDFDFNKQMKAVGFYLGAPWCAFFAKLVWKVSGVPKEVYDLVKPSALATMRAFVDAGYKIHAEPKPGYLVIYRKYVSNKVTTAGHVAVACWGNSQEFYTVDGNSNASGGREGKEVVEKQREYRWKTTDGLRLIGFIDPYEKQKAA